MPQVFGPTRPTGSIPLLRWNWSTACLVSAMK